MQRTDGVVKLLATLVVAAHALTQDFQQPDIGDLRHFFLRSGDRQGFQGVEQASRIAIGVSDQTVNCYSFDSWQRRFFAGPIHYLP